MYYLVYYGLGVALSVGSILHFGLSPWWGLPLALAFFYALSLLHIVLFLAASLVLRRHPERVTPKGAFWHWFLYSSVCLLLRILRVRVHVHGREHIPKEGPFLLVSNHLSHFDPMVEGVYLHRHRMLFVSKPENFRIPCIGLVAHRVGYIAIDRASPKQAMRAVNLMASRMKEGCPVGIYPEGTISNSTALMGFHEGVFLAAKKAETPVLVCTLAGIQNVRRRWWHFGADVHLTFCGLIPAETVEALRTHELSDTAREMMRPSLLSHGIHAVPNAEATVLPPPVKT